LHHLPSKLLFYNETNENAGEISESLENLSEFVSPLRNFSPSRTRSNGSPDLSLAQEAVKTLLSVDGTLLHTLDFVLALLGASTTLRQEEAVVHLLRVMLQDSPEYSMFKSRLDLAGTAPMNPHSVTELLRELQIQATHSRETRLTIIKVELVFRRTQQISDSVSVSLYISFIAF
jgi:hypothetical protein